MSGDQKSYPQSVSLSKIVVYDKITILRQKVQNILSKAEPTGELIVWVRRWKTVCGALVLSIVLSGCLEIEGTTTVLEDGQIIEHVVLQPRRSLLTFLALSARGVTGVAEAEGRGSDAAQDRILREFRRLTLLRQLRSVGNTCEIADLMYKEMFAKQRIPYPNVA